MHLMLVCLSVCVCVVISTYLIMNEACVLVWWYDWLTREREREREREERERERERVSE